MSLEILPENFKPTVPLQDSGKKRKRNKERSSKCNVRFLGSDHGRIYVLLCRLCRTVTAVWVGAGKDSAGAPTAHAPPARYNAEKTKSTACFPLRNDETLGFNTFFPLFYLAVLFLRGSPHGFCGPARADIVARPCVGVSSL